MGIQGLAEMMGVSRGDAQSFVSCLQIWIDKGFTFEQAIERHMAQMRRFADNAWVLASDREIRTALAHDVYDELAARAALASAGAP